MITNKLIGNKIAIARKKTNISQAQLAQCLFISPQAVGKWERGESMPDIITLNRLAEIMGVDFNYFSENFQSTTSKITPGESLDKHLAELPTAKHKKKPNWDMSSGNWVNADFSGLNNLHDKFSSSNMQRCKFIGSNLSGLLLKSNNVDSCDFSGSNMSCCHIKSSNLHINLFKDCSLKEAEFSRSNINKCDFSGSHFTGTKFSESLFNGCDFTSVDFTGVVFISGGFEKNTITKAVWNRTSFIGTQIADIVFVGTLEDCYFENCDFTRVSFQNASFINTFFKNNKKLNRIRFTDCKTDRMSYEFLKQGNADLTDIIFLDK